MVPDRPPIPRLCFAPEGRVLASRRRGASTPAGPTSFAERRRKAASTKPSPRRSSVQPLALQPNGLGDRSRIPPGGLNEGPSIALNRSWTGVNARHSSASAGTRLPKKACRFRGTRAAPSALRQQCHRRPRGPRRGAPTSGTSPKEPFAFEDAPRRGKSEPNFVLIKNITRK